MTTPTLRTAPRTSPTALGKSRAAPPRAEPLAQPLRALHRTDFLPPTSPGDGPQHRRGGLQEFTHRTAPPPVQALRTAATTPVPTIALDDPTGLCCAVARAAMESLRGIRPLSQLVRSVSPEVFDALHARYQVREQARTRPGAPPVSQARARVRAARIIRLAPDAAEASVVVEDADRVRAAALRVEEHRGRWRVVVLEIG